MAAKRKPVRTCTDDQNAREELSRLYDQTRQAVAAGDLAALARASAAARAAEVNAIMADMPAPCREPGE